MILFEETQKISTRWKIISIIFLGISYVMFLLVNSAFILGVVIWGVFTVIFFTLKLNVIIYEDRFEYQLKPYHTTHKVTLLNSIDGIDILSPKELGIYGLKIKNTPTGMFYYFGGSNIMRIQTRNKKVIYLDIKSINEIKDFLKL